MKFNFLGTRMNINDMYETNVKAFFYMQSNYGIKEYTYNFIDDFINDINENYFICIRYGVCLSCTLKETGEIPIDHNLIKLLNENDNIYLIFANDMEPDTPDVLIELKKYLQSKKIDPKKVIFISTNYYIEKYKKEIGLDITVRNISRLEKWIASEMCDHNPELVLNKEKFYTNHCRRVKPHRYFLFVNLMKMGALEDTDWSLLRGHSIKNMGEMSEVNKLLPKFLIGGLYEIHELLGFKNEINYFSSIDVKESEYEVGLGCYYDEGKTTYHQFFDVNAYKNAYVNLTTESQFEQEIIHITEKSIMPFYFYQMPLILGTKDHVAAVKDKFGFDFFDDLFDLSYDQINDNRLRFITYINEVKRLYTNKDMVINFYKNNTERLEKNKRIVTELSNYSGDVDFFRNLIKQNGRTF